VDDPSPRPTTSKDYLPARWVPLLYLGYAHAALATGFGLAAARPAGIAGFYYHPHLVAVVHAVTLGFISSSILGALYLVAPLVFRTPLPAGRADHVAFVSYAIGTTGMITHFWIDHLRGLAWAALLVLGPLTFVSVRVLAGLRQAPVPGVARLTVALSLVNILAAAALGILLAVNKETPFLPASQLQTVIAHAHLAGIGWATMMVMGVGYRLLPMILPSAMPRGVWPYAATLLTEAGTWGILIALLFGGRGTAIAAGLAALGIAVFLAQVAWMRRHPRPAPTERPRPDLPLGHLAQALVSLAVATIIGVVLALAPPSDASLRWVMVYGTLSLVGFLSQMIVGVAGRLVPLYAWLWGFVDRDYKSLPVSLHTAVPRVVQGFVLLAWTFGVPALAVGLALDRLRLIAFGSAILAASVAANAAGLSVALRRLWRDVVAVRDRQ
jgi:hypothetical protein